MRPVCAARTVVAAALMMCATELTVAVAAAQTALPGGVPDFCANPSITSARSGWSDPLTWSPARVPVAGDLVRIDAGDTVTYTSVSDAALTCISIFGQLAFGTGAPTRLTVGTLTVMEGGVLTIGTMSAPVPAGISAELVIANQPPNTSSDPNRFGTGLLGLGTVTMYGAEKTPTWTRLAIEPRAGDTLLPHVGNFTRNVGDVDDRGADGDGDGDAARPSSVMRAQGDRLPP